MSMVFLLNGTEIYSIPLEEATNENLLYMKDTRAEAYEVNAREIKTQVIKEMRCLA